MFHCSQVSDEDIPTVLFFSFNFKDFLSLSKKGKEISIGEPSTKIEFHPKKFFEKLKRYSSWKKSDSFKQVKSPVQHSNSFYFQQKPKTEKDLILPNVKFVDDTLYTIGTNFKDDEFTMNDETENALSDDEMEQDHPDILKYFGP
jgi:hypothetical protein